MTSMILLTSAHLLALYIQSVSCHSWIACTDYLEQNGHYWDPSLCRAFPRHAAQYTPRSGQFGADKGYDIINPPDDAPCRTSRNDVEAYDADQPMAVYFAGQNVVIVHPTKNHVADVRCTNKYIPDSGNQIWIGPRDAIADATLSDFRSNLVADLGVAPVGFNVPDDVTTQYPKPGFQNAPKFCENTDKSLATNSFTVPDLQPGRYTMMWGWQFNSVQDLYTSCWEVDVVSSRSERDLILLSRGLSIADTVDLAAGAATQKPVTSPMTSRPSIPDKRNTATPLVLPSGGSTNYYTMPGVKGATHGQCICQCPNTSASSAKKWLSTLYTTKICLVYVVYLSL